MEIGIIGLPNVGKSTLFNALTNANVPAENFPFTTIEPNVGLISLPDERLKKLGEIFKPQKLTSTAIKFVDIAGLVKGANEGAGLGNKFLSHIREVDVLLQVVRAFPDDKVANTLGKTAPKEEIEIVMTELILADLEQATKSKEKLVGLAHSGNKEARDKLQDLENIIKLLNNNSPVQRQDRFQEYNFLTTKSILYIFNINEHTDPVRDGINEANESSCSRSFMSSLSINIQLQYELTQLDEKDREKFSQEMGLKNDLETLIKKSYQLLNLITFYTVVGKEVRAWSVTRGTVAKKASGKIHSDMEKGFIRAEAYSFNDLITSGSEKSLHEKGLVRVEGKDYVVQDGDIIKFNFKV